MNRQETIKTLQQIAADIAQEMGYTEMRVGEDRQKGIWGESFTRYLEETYRYCKTFCLDGDLAKDHDVFVKIHEWADRIIKGGVAA